MGAKPVTALAITKEKGSQPESSHRQEIVQYNFCAVLSPVGKRLFRARLYTEHAGPPLMAGSAIDPCVGAGQRWTGLGPFYPSQASIPKGK